MENEYMTPKQLLKSYFVKTGIIIISVFLSVSLLFSLIAAFKTTNPITDIINRLGSFVELPNEIKGIGSTINGVLIAFKIIGLMPLVLLVVGSWLCFAEGKGKMKKEGTGPVLLSIYMFISSVKYILICLACFAGIIGAIALEIKGTALIVIIVIFILIMGFEALFIMYYTKFAATFLTMSVTLKGNGKNYVKFYKYVTVLTWIKAILGFLTFSSFSAFLSAALQSTMLIILLVQMKRYQKEVAMLPEIEDDGNVNLPPLFARLAKVPNGDGTKENNGIKSQQVVSKPNNNYVKNDYTKQNNQPKPQNSYVLKDGNMIDAKILAIFQDESSMQRFNLLAEKEYSEIINSNCPVQVLNIKLFKDSISERKLLQIIIKKNVDIDLVEVCFDIDLQNSNGLNIGRINNAKYIVEANAISKFGLVLPDDASCALIKLTKVTFADLLDWEKESEPYLFYTKDRIDASIDNFLKNHGDLR